MIVYMLLNTVTERCYVGATCKTLAARWKEHRDSVSEGSSYPLHCAMREWSCYDLWLVVVLQNCYTEDELSAAETAWQEHCDSHNPQVGYNRRTSSYKTSVTNGRAVAQPKKSSPLAGMSAEQRRKYFSDCGKRGASHGSKGARPGMSEEEREKYREWGRKGAAKSKKTQA